MAHDVFISYSSKDKPTADAVCATLERTGLRCWIAPRDVLPGSDWGAAIIDAINESKAMVLVYSSHANESPQIRREIERAVHKQIAVVPFRIEDVPMSKSLEYFISTPHWLDALTPPLERHIEYLAETLRRLVHLPAAPGVPPAPGGAAIRSAGQPRDADQRRDTGLRTRATPIVIGAGLLAIAAVLWLRPASAPSTGPADTTTAAPAPGASVVDPRLVGTWTTRTTVNNLPIVVTTTVTPDGQNVVTSTLTDGGRYGSGNGRWTMTNSARQVMRGTYTLVGASAMSMTGPLGTATWARNAASPPDPNGRLTGVWSLRGRPLTAFPRQRPCGLLPTARTGSRRGRATCSGWSPRAAAGRRHRRPMARCTPARTFFAGADAVQWSTQEGTALWNRSRP